MLSSRICDLVGIRYPIFQGAMSWITDATLAATVSNAGGLGILASGDSPEPVIRAQVRKLKTLTKKPFGINILMTSPNAATMARLALEEKVPVVTTGAGNPAPYIRAWLEAGITVIPVVPSTSAAQLMQRCGAHAVIAEGAEAGGHVGDLTTMALVPQVCDAVDIPVVAAGGIGDGRGMAAALMLGACGVQMGTRFLVARECPVHPKYKQKILSAKDIDTVATGARIGHPVRALKTPFTRTFMEQEYNPTATGEALLKLGTGALRLAALDGDENGGCFMAGQIAGLVRSEQSAAEIIIQTVAQAETLLSGAAQWVVYR